ncbi:MAG: PIN domain-containing protein [Verrucomicrobiae bacterium]|nr:PIN domain-containing protein [Verrucomicrobiae bacterium]
MTLIDTSAWIEFFRRKGDPAIKQWVARLISAGEAAYCCPVGFELKVGARPQELSAIETGLSFATRLPVEPAIWDAAADRHRHLKQKGITVPSSDLLIALTAVQFRASLLCRDQHFELIRANTDLPELRIDYR